MIKTLRAMLDTNVYAFLYEKDFPRITKLVEEKKLVVYGCKIIRNELREIPKSAKVEGKSYRNKMLSIYDSLTKRHSVPVEKLVEILASEYWKNYKGGTSKRKIFSDFLIVAAATIHKLDIIVSEDESTMKSEPAIKAYDEANKKNGFKTPKFIEIEKLV
jgi:predicted nucleic acid-binding protein